MVDPWHNLLEAAHLTGIQDDKDQDFNDPGIQADGSLGIAANYRPVHHMKQTLNGYFESVCSFRALSSDGPDPRLAALRVHINRL
jgi:hypothetical protein